MNEEIKQAVEAMKDPLSYSWLTYCWVGLISAWGALVSFLNSMRDRQEDVKTAFMTLVIRIITSTFVGVLTFYACELADFQKLSTAICVAVTGNMGGEALRLFQKAVLARAKLTLSVIFGAAPAAAQADTSEPNKEP